MKRIKLPSANDVLIGKTPAETVKPEEHEGTKAPKHYNAKASKHRSEARSLSREHLSVYLNPDTISQLDQTRLELRAKTRKKITRSELIERALKIGLQDPTKLL